METVRNTNSRIGAFRASGGRGPWLALQKWSPAMRGGAMVKQGGGGVLAPSWGCVRGLPSVAAPWLALGTVESCYVRGGVTVYAWGRCVSSLLHPDPCACARGGSRVRLRKQPRHPLRYASCTGDAPEKGVSRMS